MVNVVTTKPKEQQKVTKKIYCTKCEKEIKENNINNAFKITMGLIMKRDFIPAEKSVYFHQECL